MPERKCDGCTRQVEWGCTAIRWRDPVEGELDDPSNWINPAAYSTEIDGEETYACPRQTLLYQHTTWRRLLTLYGFFSKGHLPDDGPVTRQSNPLMECFHILDAVNGECTQAERDEERAKAARS